MSKMRWDRAHKPRETELAFKPEKKKAKGGWTHVKRQPVKTYSKEEIATFMAERDSEVQAVLGCGIGKRPSQAPT